jgi:hypothetical protein
VGIFDLNRIERREHVARCLGCDPARPETWPNDFIDRLLGHVETLAERALSEDIARFGSKFHKR